MNETERKQTIRKTFPTREAATKALKQALNVKIIEGSITTSSGIFTFLVGNYIMFAVDNPQEAEKVVKNLYDFYGYGSTASGQDLVTITESPEVEKMITLIGETVHPNEHDESSMPI